MKPILIIVLLFVKGFLFAQTNTYDTLQKLCNKDGYSDIITIATKALDKLKPGDTLIEKYTFFRAHAYSGLKKYAEAIPDYKTLIDLNHEERGYYLAIAEAYAQLNDYLNCFIYMDKVYQLYPDDKMVLNLMIDYHYKGQDYEGSVRYATLALDAEKDNYKRSELLVKRAGSYIELKLYDNVMSDINESFKFQTKNPLPFYYRALVNIHFMKFQSVCSDLQISRTMNGPAAEIDNLLIQYCNKNR